MKAVVYTKYGSPDVLQLKEVAKPVPKDNEVLIKIYATTATSGDSRLRSFNVPLGFWYVGRLAYGISGPRKTILGVELAGEIEAVGKDVTQFKVGDEVFGMSGMGMGANAEYRCLPEDGTLALKPRNMTYEEAASVPFGAVTAMYFLNKSKIQPGQKVLIYGASGSLGTAAVQLAKHFGADVTGVCSSANFDLVKSLGADTLIDYTQEDFTKNGQVYDVIFDTLGKTTFAGCKGSLTPDGRYLYAVAGLPQQLQMLFVSMMSRQKAIGGISSERREDLVFVKELIEAGKYVAVIDKRYPLEQTAEAHRYVDSGRKRGNVVLTVLPS